MDNWESQRVVARREGLLREELGGDLVVYDVETDTAHLLNSTSRRVFEAAGEATTVDAIARSFADAPEGERRDLVRLALQDLQVAGLVETEVPVDGVSRRQLLKRFAAAAVVAPAVVSILAPTPAMAGTGSPTCTADGQNCATTNCCTTMTRSCVTIGASRLCCVPTATIAPGGNCSVLVPGQDSANASCCGGTCISQNSGNTNGKCN